MSLKPESTSTKETTFNFFIEEINTATLAVKAVNVDEAYEKVQKIIEKYPLEKIPEIQISPYHEVEYRLDLGEISNEMDDNDDDNDDCNN